MSGVADALQGLRARWYLRRAASRGGGIRVRGRPVVILDGRADFGRGVRIDADVARVEIQVARSGELSVGDEVVFDQGCSVGTTASVTIGDGCHIGRHVQIMDNSFHRLEPEHRLERPPSRPITIGDNVWIGAMSLVLPGASIGTDSVIAERSVVTGEIPPRSLAAGAPAVVVRSL